MANQDGHGGEMRHRTDLGTRVKTERAKCVDADKGEERLKRASGSTYQKKKMSQLRYGLLIVIIGSSKKNIFIVLEHRRCDAGNTRE